MMKDRAILKSGFLEVRSENKICSPFRKIGSLGYFRKQRRRRHLLIDAHNAIADRSREARA